MTSAFSEPAPRSSLDRVITALERMNYPTKRSDRFMTLCPVHADRSPSMHVTWTDGKVMLYCFACSQSGAATFEDLARGIGLEPSDLFDAPLPPKDDRPRASVTRKPIERRVQLPAPVEAVQEKLKEPRHRFQRTVTYDYVDLEGTIVQQVFREECSIKAHPAKRFTQAFLDKSTGEMVNKKPEGFIPTLYRLADVVEAIKAGRNVYLVEGEKDADTAAANKLVATTNAQGSGAFPAELASWFVGHEAQGESLQSRVRVVADRDLAGYRRAASLYRLLTETGAKASIVLPATTEDKSDLTDHFAAGYSAGDLITVPLQTVQLMAQVEEIKLARKTVDQACEQAEARQALALKGRADEEAAENAESAKVWAKEATRRLSRIRELADLPMEMRTSDAHLATAITDVRDQAFARVNDLHTSLDLPVPPSVLDLKGGTVVSLAAAAASRHVPGTMADDPSPSTPNNVVRYAVRRGETVKITESFKDDEVKYRYDTVMNCWAEVLDQFVEDNGVETEFSRPSLGMRLKFCRWRRDQAGKPIRQPDGTIEIDEQIVTWDAETIQKGRWADQIPWYGANALASSSRRGKDNAFDGILKAVQGPSATTPKFTSTGWRETPEGRIFVHAKGAISAAGSIPADVVLPDAFGVYGMPDPTTDAGRLRDAWKQGIEPVLASLPARVIYPLLGFACESVFADRIKTTLHLQGGSGSYKTATIALAMQLFAPGIFYRGQREVISGSNGGGSPLGVIRSASVATNLPVLVDDFAPDGDPKKAQKKLGEVARLNYNGTIRAVGTVNGGVRNDRPLHAGIITSGELGAEDSAETRLLTVPLAPGDIPNAQEVLPRLEKVVARRSRALLGSSLIQYLATAMDKEIEERRYWQDNMDAPGNPYSYWLKAVQSLPHDARLHGRYSDAAQWCSHGIRLLLRMLVNRKALTIEEAEQAQQAADRGIFEALSLQNDVAGDSAHRLISYLRDAMASGEAHISGPDGDTPEDPVACGWTRKGYDSQMHPVWGPIGTRIGAIKNGRIFLIPSVVMGAANQMASRADATFGESPVSISSAMLSHGWITPDSDGKHSVQRRIAGKKMRVWDIPAEVLFGSDDDERPADPNTPGHDLPPSPPLFPGGSSTSPSPGTSETSESWFDLNEEPMAQREFIDATGEKVIMEVLDPYEPCVMCEETAAGSIDGAPMHMRCWNAAMEHLMRTQAGQQQEPADSAPEIPETPAAPPASAPVVQPVPEETTDVQQISDEDLPPAVEEPESESSQLPTFAAACAVLDTDGIHLPGQPVRSLDALPAHMGEIAELVAGLNLGTIVRRSKNRAGKWNYKAEQGQLYVTAAATQQLLGLDELPSDQRKRSALIREHTTGHPFVTAALEEGWSMSKEGKHLEGTTRMWRKDDSRRAMITFVPMLDDDAYPAIADYPKKGKPKVASAASIATRFQRFAEALEYPYTVSAASTGLNLMVELRKDREDTLKAYEPAPPALVPSLVLDHNWSRKPTAEEQGHKYIHGYDRGASYLAATDTNFGVGAPVHVDAPAFDKKTFGYWLVDVPAAAEWLYPSVFNPATRGLPEEFWYTTETLAYAQELGYEIRPKEAWIWQKSSRLLSGWAKRIIDARTALDTPDPDDQAARDIVKALYVRTLGMVGSHRLQAGRAGYAPERYDAIKSRANANILRRVVKIGNDTGRWPVALWTDVIAYTSNEPDPIKAWPGEEKHFGRGAGMYKVYGTAELSKVTKHLTGRGLEMPTVPELFV